MRKSIECKKEIKIRDELDSVSVARRRREEADGKTKEAQRAARERGTKVEGVDHGERGEHGQVAKAEDRKRKKQSEEDDSPLLLLAVWRVSRTANVPVMWASTVASTTSAR